MAMRNIKLLIEYKGTSFAGWQVQDGQNTVQGEIEAAITKITGRKTGVIGAGRTDAGVHALGQVANFHIEHQLEPSRYRDALNYYLPADIQIKHSEAVPEAFHARYDAIFRRYRYLMAQEQSALYRELRWESPFELDRVLLDEAASLVLGEHDFSAFCVVSSRKESNLCRVELSRWRAIGPLLVYEIRGNRFLHGMVRSLVGSMVNLATARQDNNMLNLTIAGFRDIMKGHGPDRVPFTAPAHGLYLVSVGY